MRKVFQIALDKIHEGWQLDDALTYACRRRSIQTGMNVMKKRGVGVFDRASRACRNIGTSCWMTT